MFGLPSFASRRPSRPPQTAALLLAVALSFAVGTFIGRFTVPAAPYDGLPAAYAQGGTEQEVDFAPFWQTWSLLKNRFYQPLSDEDLYYGAVKGLVASVDDPYTVFLDPQESRQFADDLEGAFDGIGAEIAVRDGQLQIVSPLPGTPAERAGLRPGDHILAIDDTSTDGLLVGEAVRLIRGERGTPVALLVRRGDAEPVSHAITRDKITVESVTWKVDEEPGIAVISVALFGPDTPRLFTQAVNDVLASGARGLVVDLRGNPGGLLSAAVDIASAWTGTLPVVREKGPGVNEVFAGRGAARLAGLPTVVLVDEGSASASEILAGALQDHGLATVVGQPTFGKGSVQDLVPLQDGSSVKITIAAWHTPNDRSIEGSGIAPDVAVAFTEQDLHEKRDAQKEKAFEILRDALAGR